MNVLLDTQPLQTGHNIRGIGTYTRELLRALRELPADLGLVLQTTADAPPDFLPDLIHYPYFDFFFSTLKISKKLPTVVTVHDTIPFVFPEHYPPGIKGSLRWQRQRHALRKVQQVITDSVCSAQDIARYCQVPSEKISVVPLAASPDLQPQSDYLVSKNTETLNLPEKYVLYIGDINYNKNLPTLLLAITQLPPELHLVVISAAFSDTSIPEGAELEAIIKANGLRERVHHLTLPSGEPAVVAAVIQRARALVQPSLYEGFGLPVLEAMQIGTPVVCSNVASLPEVAGEAAILVDPTIRGLTDGLLLAWKLRGSERDEWVAKGRAQAAKFSWEKTAIATLQVYLDALEHWKHTK